MRALRVVLAVLLWPIALLLGLACSTAAVVAQRGRGVLYWDVLTHFAPVWLAGAGLAALIGLAFKGGWRWSLVTVGAVGLLASAALIAPEFLRDAGPTAKPPVPGQLKLIQFNILYDNPHPEEVLAWLDTERPDIVVLEETSIWFRRALARHGHWQVACGACEVTVLSRLPYAPSDVRRGDASAPGPLTAAKFHDGLGAFEVIGVHNAWPTDRDQPFQEARLADEVSRAGDRQRLIVAGDFNSTPWSFARRRWDAAIGLPRRDRAISSWPARDKRSRWPTPAVLPIDHIYAGPGWATLEVRRGPRLSSDHYPLVITLAPVAPR